MKKAGTVDDGTPFAGGGGGGGLPDGPRRSARQAALTPKPRPKSRPRAVNRAIMRDIGSRPVDVLLARVAFGMRTSLLHPQLVSLIAMYHERGTPQLPSSGKSPPQHSRFSLYCLYPLPVASIWLRDVANAISNGADPIAAMNGTLLEEAIARWYMLHKHNVRLAEGEASAKRKARARARSAGLKLEARVRSARRKT